MPQLSPYSFSLFLSFLVFSILLFYILNSESSSFLCPSNMEKVSLSSNKKCLVFM